MISAIDRIATPGDLEFRSRYAAQVMEVLVEVWRVVALTVGSGFILAAILASSNDVPKPSVVQGRARVLVRTEVDRRGIASSSVRKAS